MQGQNSGKVGLSGIAGRKALATAEGVYADIRRGLPMTENAADGPLSLTALTL